MDRRPLAYFLNQGNEELGVDFKSWMNPTEPLHAAKIAKHIAALANHGGGHLVFGVNDKTRTPEGETELDRGLFSQDSIASIVHRYLEPRVQINVQAAAHDGVEYPVLIVGGHGDRPVVAIKNGPEEGNKGPQGISRGTIYIRSPKPESVPISSPDDWFALINRCLMHRADIMGNMLRQTLDRHARPPVSAFRSLAAVTNDTCDNFAAQIEVLANEVPDGNDAALEAVLNAKASFAAMSYALLDNQGDFVRLEGLRSLANRASVSLEQYAYYGWSWFLPQRSLEQAPQVIGTKVGDEQLQYLEGARLDRAPEFRVGNDYWRIYDHGMAVAVDPYTEDEKGRELQSNRRHLLVYWSLLRVHSLLMHARFVGTDVGVVQQVLVRTDWRGLDGRWLVREKDFERIAGGPPVDGRFIKEVAIPWSTLRDDYFSAFVQVALPIFDFFPPTGQPAEEWLNKAFVEAQFAKSKFGALRLPDE